MNANKLTFLNQKFILIFSNLFSDVFLRTPLDDC